MSNQIETKISRSRRLILLSIVALIGAQSTVAAYTAIRSLSWPMVLDAPLMNYVAWRILSGDVPYRDIFDMNMPGTYLIHMFILILFGQTDSGWYLFDIAWVGFALISIAIYSSHNKWAAVVATGIFVTLYFGYGMHNIGQRDFLLCPILMLAGHLLAWSIETDNHRGNLLLAGIALGSAATIKPYAIILLLFFALIYLASVLRSERGNLFDLLSLAVGGSLVPVLVVLWLIWAGGWISFWRMTVEALLPIYSVIHPAAYSTLLNTLASWILIFIPVLLLLPALLLAHPKPRLLRYVILGSGILYGVLHFVIQGKGWGYHLFPFLFFSSSFAGMAFADLLAKKHIIFQIAGLLGLLFVSIPLIANSASLGSIESASFPIKSHGPQLAKEISEYGLSERDTVQVLDVTGGGIHALYLLHLRQPTRFIYDWQFFNAIENPFIQELRSEFLRDLGKNPPRLIVIFEDDGFLPLRASERLSRFPAFEKFLAANYTVSKAHEAYTIYQANNSVQRNPRLAASK